MSCLLFDDSCASSSTLHIHGQLLPGSLSNNIFWANLHLSNVVTLWSLGEEAWFNNTAVCLSLTFKPHAPESVPFKGIHFSHTSCQVARPVDRCLLRAFVTFLKSPSLISCSCHVPKPTLLFQHLSLSRNATRCTAELISSPVTPHKFQVETSGMRKCDCML